MPRNPISSEQLSAWIKSDDEAKYSLDDRGGCSGNDSRWYEHDKSMIALSAQYPTTLFKLHGEGEENGDFWDKYYFGGALKHTETLKAELPVPDFDQWVPSPQATAKKRILRIKELIEDTQAGENFDLRLLPDQYLAIEYAFGGVTLAAYGGAILSDITSQINESDTTGRDYITVYDLDTDKQFNPHFAVTHYTTDSGPIDANGISL